MIDHDRYATMIRLTEQCQHGYVRNVCHYTFVTDEPHADHEAIRAALNDSDVGKDDGTATATVTWRGTLPYRRV